MRGVRAAWGRAGENALELHFLASLSLRRPRPHGGNTALPKHASNVPRSNPDLVRYANTFGILAWRVAQAGDFAPMLRRALDLDVPSLIEVPVDHTENMRLGSPPGE